MLIHGGNVMPIQLQIWERRQNGDRQLMADAALFFCRAVRQTKGITSSRFYWSGTERMVLLTQGEGPALNAPFSGFTGDRNQLAKHTYDIQDHVTVPFNIRLTEPQAEVVVESYRSAGRM
jgi:hypothetical protein